MFSRRLFNPAKGSEEDKAVSELLRLKVHELMTDDEGFYSYSGTFSDVWFACAHETDTFESYVLGPNGSMEDYRRYMGHEKGLNRMTYQSAIRWLARYEHLVKEE